jgi:hypothetical protein
LRGGVLLLALCSQSAFAERHQGKKSSSGYATHQQNGGVYSSSAGHIRLEISDNWKPFLPSDTVYSESTRVGKRCDEDANYVQNNSFAFCKPVYSQSNNTHYIVRRDGSDGDRIFLVKIKKNELYVQFDGGGSVVSGSHVVIYASPEALKFAEKNGYVLDKRNNTMVKVGSEQDASSAQAQTTDNSTTSQTTNIADCASKTALLEKMKCIADNTAAMKK